MAQKVFYKYNEAKERFERVFPSRRQRFFVVLRQLGMGIAVAAIAFVVAYGTIDFPREKELRRENRELMQQVEIMNRRSDEALSVMENLVERDNNLLRVILQADPISDGTRYAGLERRKAYDRIDSMSDNTLLRSVQEKLDRLDRMIYVQIKSYDSLRTTATNQDVRLAHIPAIPPVSQKNLRALASGYGYRRDPVYGTTKFHEGMDFSAPVGTPVYATGDGRVTTASWQSSYGNLVEIEHGYNYTTRYAHLSDFAVSKGQEVHRGDLIGYVGNTGKSTGPHLHYEVRIKGAPQNPVNYYFFDLSPQEYDEMIRLAENAGHVMD